VASCRRVDWNWGQDFEQSQSNHGWPRVALVHGLGTRRGSSQRSNIRTKSGRLSLRTSATRRHAWLARPDDEMTLPRWASASRLVPIPRRPRGPIPGCSPHPGSRSSRWIGPFASYSSIPSPSLPVRTLVSVVPSPVMPNLFIMCT